MQDEGSGATPQNDATFEQVLAGGQPQTVGRFRFYIDDERWEWSDEVQRMHGYEPRSLPNPTTAQVLAHKHPDDQPHVLDALEESRRTRAAFSTRHRMIDVHGRLHHVVLVADQLRDDVGAVVGTDGFYVDITPIEQAREARISAAVADIADNRAVIEQAKGMLELLYGVDDATAFELLRWRSQEANTKLRRLAEQLVEDFRALSGEELPRRVVYDKLLMSVQQRVD